jgi:hypothetical protein
LDVAVAIVQGVCPVVLNAFAFDNYLGGEGFRIKHDG